MPQLEEEHPEHDEVPQDEDSPFLRVAKELHQIVAQARPHVMYCNRNHLQSLMRALAQCSSELQMRIFRQTIEYVQAMTRANLVEPICLIHSLQYDETPLRLRVSWQDREAQPEMNKLYVVQQTWLMLLQKKQARQSLKVGMTLSSFVHTCLQHSGARQQTQPWVLRLFCSRRGAPARRT